MNLEKTGMMISNKSTIAAAFLCPVNMFTLVLNRKTNEFIWAVQAQEFVSELTLFFLLANKARSEINEKANDWLSSYVYEHIELYASDDFSLSDSSGNALFPLVSVLVLEPRTFLIFPGFQPSAGTLPASVYSEIHEAARSYIPSASALEFPALDSGLLIAKNPVFQFYRSGENVR